MEENAQGYVDTLYYEEAKTVRQIVLEYSKPGDRLSAHVKELNVAGKVDEKFPVLVVIEPKTPEPGKKGVAAMPYGTVHIDVKNKVIMRRGGFDEMPVAVSRATRSSRPRRVRGSRSTSRSRKSS